MRHGVLDETFFTGMGKSCDFLVECAVKGVDILGGGLHG